MEPSFFSSKVFHCVTKKIKDFFEEKGWSEIYNQNRHSILTCIDLDGIITYTYKGMTLPLPQSSEIWLDYELLQEPEIPGFFSISSSYNKHDGFLPKLEFVSKGSIEDLIKLESELLKHMGFDKEHDFTRDTYMNITNKYNIEKIENEDMIKLDEDYGPIFFLTDFPEHTSPFWNIERKNKKDSNKVDVIIHGEKTISSSEKSCDSIEMRRCFYTINDGGYANTLFDKFGQENVKKELELFFNSNFFQRYGGSIDITRLIKGLTKSQLIREQ